MYCLLIWNKIIIFDYDKYKYIYSASLFVLEGFLIIKYNSYLCFVLYLEKIKIK